MDSILTSIKKLIGITESDDGFDTDLIIHINTAFMGLTDLHVGPSTGFIITDKSAVWTDFIKDPKKLAASKTYVYLRVKLLFDAESLSSSYIATIERQIDKLEWMLNVDAESDTFDIDDANVSEEIKALIADLENENEELKALAAELKSANELLIEELKSRIEALEKNNGLTDEQRAAIEANTEARHTHSNKIEVLDKFTLDDNSGLLFDGQPIKAESVDPRVTTAQTVALLLESNGITEVVTEAPDVASIDGSDFAYKMSELNIGYTLLYVPTEDGVLTYTAPFSDAVEMRVFAGGIYEFKYDVDTWQTSVEPCLGVKILEFFKSKLFADINIPTWNGGAY